MLGKRSRNTQPCFRADTDVGRCAQRGVDHHKCFLVVHENGLVTLASYQGSTRSQRTVSLCPNHLADFTSVGVTGGSYLLTDLVQYARASDWWTPFLRELVVSEGLRRHARGAPWPSPPRQPLCRFHPPATTPTHAHPHPHPHPQHPYPAEHWQH